MTITWKFILIGAHGVVAVGNDDAKSNGAVGVIFVEFGFADRSGLTEIGGGPRLMVLPGCSFSQRQHALLRISAAFSLIR